MKIGIVTTWYERGASYVSLQYAQQLFEEGHEVLIYARGGYDSSFHPEFSVEVDEDSSLIVRSALNIKQYKIWLEKNRITHVLFNEQFWWKPILLSKSMGVVCAAYIDYYTKNSIGLFDVYDLIFCNTKRHFSVFEHLSSAVYVPWGTNVDLFQPPECEREAKDQVVFFHSAGWSPYRKGTDLLLDAFYEIDSEYKLIIHAQCDLEKELREKSSKIQKMKNLGRLEIISKTVGGPGLYHLGDVYVYPTRLEGIGLSIAEAMACGLPVIVPENAPMNEFVSTGSCRTVDVERFFYREDDYYWPICEVKGGSLIKQIEFYISNKDKLESFSRDVREHSEIYLNWAENAKNLGEYFDDAAVQEDCSPQLIIELERSDMKSMKLGWLFSLSPVVYRIFVRLFRSLFR
ncbi:glycosyltransferase [Halioglobus maricola]|uniref:Glycosyltransferase n=1 Tax=Halioglobus maricola TaxID=2601894 RepID=A0A5P9NFQ7_9GAMM|nr:glycosyltransferase family 4 protein [Halioglobus maricola]QFU74612.1 glycosyltransferase [Halioglobus maricola]